jgi:methyl-accepting chemotaxis protein
VSATEAIIATMSSLGVLGGCAGVASLLRYRSQNAKDRADSVAIVSDAAGRQVERLEAEVDRINGKLRTAEDTIDQLSTRTEELLAEVMEYRRRFGPLRPTGT